MSVTSIDTPKTTNAFVDCQQMLLSGVLQAVLYDDGMNTPNFDMTAYSGRLAYAMSLAGMTNQSELALLLGTKPQNIQHLLKKGKGSRHNSKLATILNVDPDWLAYGQGSPKRQLISEETATYNVSFVSEEQLQKRHDVPLLTSISAGKWIHHHGAFTEQDAEGWLPCPVIHSPMAFAMKVDGHSMTSPYLSEKSYPHGAFVYFEPEKPYQNGSLVAAYLHSKESITFKQYVEDAGRKYLRPLNPSFKEIPIEDDDIEIIGVLIGAFTIA